MGPLTVLARGIPADNWDTNQPACSAVLDEMSTLRYVFLTEKADSLLRDMRRTPEVDLEFRTRNVVRDRLDLTKDCVPRVIEYNVHSTERLVSRYKRCCDLFDSGHVKLDDQETVLRVLC